MCGRYVLTTSPEALRALFRYREEDGFPARYNIAPTQPIPVVRRIKGEPGFALATGVVAAAMERWTPGRWDNLTIPLASAAAIQFCHTWLR